MILLDYVAPVAATVIISRSSIVGLARDKVPERLRSFLECPMCTGFWVGLVYGWVLGDHAVQWSLFSSVVSYLLVSVTDSVSAFTQVQEGMVREWAAAAVEQRDRQEP